MAIHAFIFTSISADQCEACDGRNDMAVALVSSPPSSSSIQRIVRLFFMSSDAHKLGSATRGALFVRCRKFAQPTRQSLGVPSTPGKALDTTDATKA